jgi:hypothetical protein
MPAEIDRYNMLENTHSRAWRQRVSLSSTPPSSSETFRQDDWYVCTVQKVCLSQRAVVLRHILCVNMALSDRLNDDQGSRCAERLDLDYPNPCCARYGLMPRSGIARLILAQ